MYCCYTCKRWGEIKDQQFMAFGFGSVSAGDSETAKWCTVLEKPMFATEECYEGDWVPNPERTINKGPFCYKNEKKCPFHDECGIRNP